jgi:streptogramin lyase
VNASVVNGQTTFNKIGRITTDGAITEYDLPPAIGFQGAWFIMAGPDGALWFTDGWTNRIMRAAFAPGTVVANTFLPYGMTEVSYSARLIAHWDPFI